MDCRSFRKHHLAYLDDTLSGDQMGAAQRHILECNACAGHDTLVRRSLMVARSMPTIVPSAAFQARLQARLAECREQRQAERETSALDEPDTRPDSVMGPSSRLAWRSPRTLVALAASAVIGALIWRGATAPAAPLVAMQPVIASRPARPEVRYASPALLQAMAPGSPVWGAALIIDDVPTQFVNVDYSMLVDGR